MRWLPFFWALVATSLCCAAPQILNNRVQRVVDASSAVVSARYDIQFQRIHETEVEGGEDSDLDLVAPYMFALPALQAARLAHLTAQCDAVPVPISPPTM